MRIALTVEGELEEKCRAAALEGKHKGVNHWLIDLLLKHFSGPAKKGPRFPSKRSKRQKMQDLLDAVERRYWFAPACKAAEVTRDEARKWLEDEGFQAAYEDAQFAFIESIEARMLRFGTAKGVVLAFLSFLNANHPKYGRVKIEFLNRFLGPFLDEIYALIRKKCGAGPGSLGEKLIEEIQQAYEKRLLAFTD